MVAVGVTVAGVTVAGVMAVGLMDVVGVSDLVVSVL